MRYDYRKLDKLLKERGVSAASLAYETGLSEAAISYILNGKRPFRTVNAKAIAYVLEIDDAVLMTDEELAYAS